MALCAQACLMAHVRGKPAECGNGTCGQGRCTAANGCALPHRHGATSVGEFRAQGYLAPAMINFLSLLGWNDGTEQEIFSVPELTSKFSLDRITKSAAVFDKASSEASMHVLGCTCGQACLPRRLLHRARPISCCVAPCAPPLSQVKLGWMNGQHLKLLPEEESAAMAAQHLVKVGLLASADSAFAAAAIKLVSKSMVRWSNACVAIWLHGGRGVCAQAGLSSPRLPLLGPPGAGDGLRARAAQAAGLPAGRDDGRAGRQGGAGRQLRRGGGGRGGGARQRRAGGGPGQGARGLQGAALPPCSPARSLCAWF
jgi:hypothetical protein